LDSWFHFLFHFFLFCYKNKKEIMARDIMDTLYSPLTGWKKYLANI
jgi:hypothetical protein